MDRLLEKVDWNIAAAVLAWGIFWWFVGRHAGMNDAAKEYGKGYRLGFDEGRLEGKREAGIVKQ